MILPDSVRRCMDALEHAGYPCYAVGGCVRDSLLGLMPHDYDLCSAALPQEVCTVFSDHSLVRAGEKHGTIGVVTEDGVVEITTFRTEGNYTDSRHPGWVRFVHDIEGDLSRRDFTVNAMAYSPLHGFADPFGGQQDLTGRILRTVGDPRVRFQEDALRILRGVRFAVKYRLTVEAQTMDAMIDLAPQLDRIARERVFDELCKLLPLVTADDLLTFAPVLAQAIPELRPMIGFDQRNPHHVYDLYAHTAHVTEGVNTTLLLRWAALLHDVGKIDCFTLDEQGIGHFLGHAKAGAQRADEILFRLKAPNVLREKVVQLISLHMTPIGPNKKSVRRYLSRLGEETLGELLLLQRADLIGTGTSCTPSVHQLDAVSTLVQEVVKEDSCLNLKSLAVKGNDLIALGYSGKDIGLALQTLLDGVLDETVPNERAALLAFLQEKNCS